MAAGTDDADNVYQAGYTRTLKVGSFKVLAIVDSPTTFSTALLLPDFRRTLPEGEFRGVVKTWLVDTGRDRVLIDAGWGAHGKVPGRTVEALKANGYDPSDITHVIMTHLDMDHVGGLGAGGRATFPNAVLHVSRPEYDAWTGGRVNRGEKAVTLAKEQLALYRVDPFKYGSEPVPGFRALDAHGHTPGHAVIEISSDGKRFFVLGDLFHIIAVQLRFPGACTSYDMDEKAAVASRFAVLDRLSNEKVRAGGMHFPEIGLIHKEPKGFFTMQER